jgi:hypothetical protein
MATFEVPPAVGPYDARSYLTKFLDSVETQLDEAVKTAPGDLIPEALHARANAAFNDVRPVFGQMKAAMPHLTDTDLIDHGLQAGPQLGYKLALVNHQNTQLQAPNNPPKRRRGIFRKLLEAIDVLLKSLIKAVGLGDALEEFKDALEKGVPEDFGENQ